MNNNKTGNLFLKYLKNREFDNLETILSEDVVFQALLPSKNPFREANNNSDTVGYFKSWFGDADKFKMKKSQSKHLQGKRHFISYHVDLHDEDGWQKVLQTIYCNIEDGIITSLALNCSGYLPLGKD
ncbi:MAG: hypothetical protein IH840_13275 [Candidatus Heimdallarchaeota archaeon]|nr:hypothetical protein [Candidatus Heimdallarchaeota archaeon]